MTADSSGASPVVRAFTPSDSNQLAALAATTSTAAQWPANSYSLLAKPPYFALVSAQTNRLIGFIAARIVADEAEILNLVVDALYRRQGFGKQLLESAEREARARGAKTVFLEVRESNSSAIRFYESNGFTNVGFRANYYRDPAEPATIMKKLLMRKL